MLLRTGGAAAGPTASAIWATTRRATRRNCISRATAKTPRGSWSRNARWRCSASTRRRSTTGRPPTSSSHRVARGGQRRQPREPHGARPTASHRRHGHRAADEDRGRIRRAGKGCGARAQAVDAPPGSLTLAIGGHTVTAKLPLPQADEILPSSLPHGLTRELVLDCLARIQASPQFAASDRLKRFLGYVVHETLSGSEGGPQRVRRRDSRLQSRRGVQSGARLHRANGGGAAAQAARTVLSKRGLERPRAPSPPSRWICSQIRVGSARACRVPDTSTPDRRVDRAKCGDLTASEGGLARTVGRSGPRPACREPLAGGCPGLGAA